MKTKNSKTLNYDYPFISDELIKCLERDFPDKLPRTKTDEFELGKAIGQQIIIDKLKCEKEYNENKIVDDEI